MGWLLIVALGVGFVLLGVSLRGAPDEETLWVKPRATKTLFWSGDR